ncbi:ribosomal protein S10 domain-containing protein [Coniochaeta sp. 2T2.1]|nr:ribosomal protein S10 domain-containing protein [Coniochaeta sp. 2T2.1]
MPPLIRPLRPLLQKRIPLSTALRPSASLTSGQIRTYASVDHESNTSTPSKQPPAADSINPPLNASTTSDFLHSEGERLVTESQLLQEQSRRALGTAPPTPSAVVNATTSSTPALDASVSSPADTRMPRSLAALYLKPLRREAEYGVPSCDLQLRSYTLRNLEFYCDFALRAAYYLGLPAYGPVPLPRMIERWTVPRSSFIFKKSQENFERITLRRLIQIRDGHPDTVQVWLAFLQKHAYYGVGMKANVWEFSKLGVGKAMDESVKEVEDLLQDKWAHLGEQKRPEDETVEKIQEFLDKERMTISHGR